MLQCIKNAYFTCLKGKCILLLTYIMYTCFVVSSGNCFVCKWMPLATCCVEADTQEHGLNVHQCHTNQAEELMSWDSLNSILCGWSNKTIRVYSSAFRRFLVKCSIATRLLNFQTTVFIKFKRWPITYKQHLLFSTQVCTLGERLQVSVSWMGFFFKK